MNVLTYSALIYSHESSKFKRDDIQFVLLDVRAPKLYLGYLILSHSGNIMKIEADSLYRESFSDI